ncbi:MAG: hypothetical protein Q7R35_04315 [Elusimicrobiota bacterium]|nr:hypothetical protein [Elusimicrobiota bacterium]
MKAILTAVFLTVLAGGAGAFELQNLDAAGVKAFENSAIPEPVQKAAVNDVETAYATIKDCFDNLSYSMTEPEVAGTWEGRLFRRNSQGYLEVKPMEVTFTKKKIPSELGPFFQEDKIETHVQFPYFETLLERLVTFDPKGGGYTFQFRYDGLFTVAFHRMNRGNERVLLMKSDCYGEGTYAYFMRKNPATKQAYTGGLPLGDLFGPLPPYFHGETPPLLLANGLAAQGAFEYSNRIIFYKDKSEALAAAETAAAVIRAAGREVLSVKAEELNGFYYSSVGFSGKRANIYRWDDDAATAEEAAEILKRKTARYQSEGYSILETHINKVGNKHSFFIICAKFH